MFSQRDPKWRDVILGFGPYTIGQQGCLLCCMAWVLYSHGVDTDPVRLNDYLKKRKGYVDGCRMVFDSFRPFGLKLRAVRDYRGRSADVIRMRYAWDEGLVQLLEVDFCPGGKFQSHWVGFVGFVGNDVEVVDPWPYPAEVGRLLRRYALSWWTLERAIYRVAEYEWEEGR